MSIYGNCDVTEKKNFFFIFATMNKRSIVETFKSEMRNNIAALPVPGRC